MTSEFAAAAVLITYGAVLGKVSRLQLLVIGILEIVFYSINEMIAIEFLKYADAGGSIIIHTFGAYFGLALSRVLYNQKSLDNPKEESVYHSDLFAMIGKNFRCCMLIWRSLMRYGGRGWGETPEREPGNKGGGKSTGGWKRNGGKRDSQGDGNRKKEEKITQHLGLISQ